MLPLFQIMAGVCALTTAPVVLEHTSQELYESWTIPDGTALFEAGRPETENYANFLAWVRASVNPEQTALLERQRKIYAASSYSEEVKKFDLILSHQAGRLHPSRCLEAALFNEHLMRQDSAAVQTEFAALILTRGTELKIYFSSGFATSPPTITKFEDRLTVDLKAGWSLLTLLHNHIFFFKNAPGDIAGTTIPSGADVDTFLDYAQRFGLKEAWITNGIDTITLTASEFERFRTTRSDSLAE